MRREQGWGVTRLAGQWRSIRVEPASLQPGPSERSDILVALVVALEGHLRGEPLQRQTRLHAEQGFEGCRRPLPLFGHRRRSGEHTMAAAEAGTKGKRFPCK